MRVTELREHEDALGFRPQEAVRWLSPAELWRAGVKVVLSSLFADYADKREIQAGLPAGPALDLRGGPDADLWIDYVADLGDGFDATCTVASLLAADKLEPTVTPGATGVPGPLPRAGLLVLGGDEVYPTASARAYEDRMRGPYRSALSSAGQDGDRPLMVVLPGNHDWYDGLTSFLRTFTQERLIGGWRTAQKRSYFAVRLPHGWWLLGLDSQFGNDLDEPQLRWFDEEVSRHLEPGDSVVLCTATPTWVESAEEVDDEEQAQARRDAFNSLHWFDRQYVRRRPDGRGGREETGASVRLWITGDSHHYARFAERLPTDPDDPPEGHTGTAPSLRPDPRRRQLVTCGLGGAYLAATHGLPEVLALPPAGSRMREKDHPTGFARAEVCYPDRATSARLSRRLALPWSRYWLLRRNPHFGALAAGVHVVLLLVLSWLLGGTTRQGPVSALRTAEVPDVLPLLAWVTVLPVVALLVPWLRRPTRRSPAAARSSPSGRAAGRRPARTRSLRAPSPVVAGVLLQLLVADGVLLTAVAVDVPATAPGWLVLAAGCAWAAAVGWFLGSEAFAVFVLLAGSGQVFGWQMSGQAVEDGKGFVRMHVDHTGTLTLHPLVVDEVCRDWTLVPDVDARGGEDPRCRRAVPAGDLPVPRLLEDPVVIAPTGGAT
ncbi:hypothetical protein SAMN05660657_03546 [Geodermatophilus amargosae]|uniref:Calcineurin-like phosphoesterase n=1 Tax=Geodermatophilus amargosae TaxID=1296565 RepID=A0A1I7BG92_9ACTN|nr:metallophosphoesterase [Geodermatophilus amargosae]SFT86194.1 hypothetical protein SAMN05660657_03546 [Geodermatophilus amargosae]